MNRKDLSNIPPINTISHEFGVEVGQEDIDALNHVNNLVYVKWINDASEKHWAILSNAKINAKYYWVCLRHEIDYLGEAFLGDEITVITWVGESKGVKSKRHVAIVKDQTLIAKAETLWCLIDSKTQKPARINSEILDLLSA
ncbi:acyl-CoA thioesterase [Algibacter mikhailovii]|uniref:acyl-CoA thioesterase n=1 Tax=Algibacter mikhailovii TaxID=425498 RepID=UPI0024946526|nr:thioesterase family protein [Algibacter mikhailovii]